MRPRLSKCPDPWRYHQDANVPRMWAYAWPSTVDVLTHDIQEWPFWNIDEDSQPRPPDPPQQDVGMTLTLRGDWPRTLSRL